MTETTKTTGPDILEVNARLSAENARLAGEIARIEAEPSIPKLRLVHAALGAAEKARSDLQVEAAKGKIRLRLAEAENAKLRARVQDLEAARCARPSLPSELSTGILGSMLFGNAAAI